MDMPVAFNCRSFMENRRNLFHALPILAFALPSAADATGATPPRSIYALQTPRWQSRRLSSRIRNVDDVASEFLWVQLEPGDGDFDFSRLDGLISRAA